MYACSIYEDRPQICRDFPLPSPKKSKVYPSCAYWFNRNMEIQGECNRCGECCKFCKVFTKRAGRCPYLIFIEE